jgi:hypothetical protein
VSGVSGAQDLSLRQRIIEQGLRAVFHEGQSAPEELVHRGLVEVVDEYAHARRREAEDERNTDVTCPPHDAYVASETGY